MPPGPKPKDPAKRQRTNEPEFPPRELIAGLQVKAPRLPMAKAFCKETRDWYKTWAQSEQAQAFLATDWQRLHMLAHLVNAFYVEYEHREKQKLLSEIRLNEKELGATAESRLRLRWKVTEAPTVEEAKVSAPRRRDPRLSLVKDASG